MELDALFLATIDDLRGRCDLRASEYDMVQASGLIRRLLMDGTPLWDQVNRQYRTRPEFKWATVWLCRINGDERLWVPGLTFDPAIAQATIDVRRSQHPETPETRVAYTEARKVFRSGTLKDFLGTEVLRRKVDGEADQTATVRDLIKDYANCRGGVHFDASGRSVNEVVERVVDFAEADLRRTILACGRIVLRALEPMAAALTLKDIPWPAGLGAGFSSPPTTA